MKVLLISPPLRNMAAYQMRARGCMPPLNLLYLAAALRGAGHEPALLDLYAKPRPLEETLRFAEEFSPGAVGFASYTANLDETEALAAALKARLPGAVTLIGGIHASYLPEITLARAAFDIAVVGEGERTVVELADALAAGRGPEGVAGLAYRRDGAFVRTPPRPQTDDIDHLPWPAWDLVDLKDYYLASTRAVTDRRAASVLTMRGCAYSCSFCSHSFCYPKVKARSPRDVVDEIEFLAKERGVGEFQLEDSTFTCLPGRALEICRLIKERGLDIVWSCNIRADNMTRELFAAMRAAGCRRVLLGVEAGTQEMLDAMKKGITLEQVRRTAAWAKEFGVRVNAAFMLGAPGETRESAWAAYRFALELDTDYVMFSSLVPSVGSDYFDLAVAQKKVDPASARGADYITVYAEKTPLAQMSELSRPELAALMERFTRGYYLRPRYILRRLAGLRSLNEAAGMLAGFALVVIHQLGALRRRSAS